MAELIEDDGDVKTEALDNAQPVITLDSSDVSSIASESVVSLTTYQTLDSLPITGLSGGDQAYVRANNRLYISNGLGWYNVSLINLSPRFDSDINSAFSIVDSQTPLIINNPASDSDNPDAIITYGGTMSDSGQYLVALTRDSSVWTFTPLSADSVYDNVTLGNLTDSDGGSFTYSFTASDNINQAVKTITITYDGLKPAIGVVDSSSATVLLMKARNTGSQPNAIFSLILAFISRISWGTNAQLSCHEEISVSDNSMPSNNNFPLVGVNNPKRMWAIVVFPLPVLPTNATREPIGIDKFTFSRMSSIVSES